MMIQRYRQRISGPLLDRIDIHIEVPAVRYQELSRKSDGDCSADIRARVIRAREVQLLRFRSRRIYSNAQMLSKDIQDFCTIDEASSKLLKTAVNKFGLSARAYDRILKVARTCADLEGNENISMAHIAEAIQYRSLDRNLWM